MLALTENKNRALFVAKDCQTDLCFVFNEKARMVRFVKMYQASPPAAVFFYKCRARELRLISFPIILREKKS